MREEEGDRARMVEGRGKQGERLKGRIRLSSCKCTKYRMNETSFSLQSSSRVGSNWSNKHHICQFSVLQPSHSVMNKILTRREIELTRKNPASVIVILHLTQYSFPPTKLARSGSRYRISEEKVVILIIGKLDLCKDFEGGAEVRHRAVQN